jgi:hypothetical protein
MSHIVQDDVVLIEHGGDHMRTLPVNEVIELGVPEDAIPQ